MNTPQQPSQQTPRNILVTSAMVYANGSFHLGHMLEQIQADIWVRFQRLRGHRCFYVFGDDAHGTPIMLSAEKQEISPEALIQRSYAEHQQDLTDFLISADNFYTTHAEENRALAHLIYQRLAERGDIESKTIAQAFDAEKQMFLPDRYVKGTCPKCKAPEQYGDSCEVCGATYSPMELIDPISTLSNSTPITKQSEHFFFKLSHYTEMLQQWCDAGHLQSQVQNKLKEWLDTELVDWDITRDSPYFGFTIPGCEDKYFYVWLDAPIGYMASFKNLCDQRDDLNFDDFWHTQSTAELYHFIGKDIINFHGLFWPAMLHGAGFRTPTAIFTHGFVTVNGEKMSKSRGTFIKVRTYLDHFEPEYLRYYFAAKLSNGVDDIDLNLEDFMLRVNADLVGKVVNIASRCAGFIHKKFAGKLSGNLHQPELLALVKAKADKIAEYYEQRHFNRAVREIMAAADAINQYIDTQKPWQLAKTPGCEKQVHDICSQGLECFRLLMIYLKPILPVMAEKVEHFLNIQPLQWQDIESTMGEHEINPFKPLMTRVEAKQLDALQQAARS